MPDMSVTFTLSDAELRKLRRTSWLRRVFRRRPEFPAVDRRRPTLAIRIPASTVAASRPTMIPEGWAR